MPRGWITLPLALMLAAACSNAERSPDDDRDYDVVVTDPDDSAATKTAPGEDEPDFGEPLGSPPPTLGSPPPTLGSPPPDQELPSEEAVGWVSVIASDGNSYEVLQNGSPRGVSTVRLTQRPGDGEYALRDESGRVMCRRRVDVRQYESLCLECDVRTGKFRMERC